MAECPPREPEARGFLHSTRNPAWWCRPAILAFLRVRQKDQGHPQLHCEFEVSLGYVGPCWKKREREEGKGDDGKKGERQRKRINSNFSHPMSDFNKSELIGDDLKSNKLFKTLGVWRES